MKKLLVLVFAIALCLGASAAYDENGFGTSPRSWMKKQASATAPLCGGKKK